MVSKCKNYLSNVLYSVIRSGYNTLQSQTAQGGSSRFSRILFRDDIASKIAKEDKKLDDAITAFQVHKKYQQLDIQLTSLCILNTPRSDQHRGFE